MATDYNGNLKYNLGNILIFMVSAKFLLDLTEGQNLTTKNFYNKAYKKVSHVNTETWEDIVPESENAWKFELFIHSFVPFVEEGKLGVMIVDRDSEFAPVKNIDGADPDVILPDTPSNARRMILLESARWLEHVSGLKIEASAVEKVEVSPLLSYNGENLNWLKHVYRKKTIGGEGGWLDHAGEYTEM